MPKVIVVGNQKSGTSAVAALLAGFARLSYQQDIPAFWGDGFSRILNGSVSFSDAVKQNKREFNRGLVKEPNFTFLTDQIRRHFPEAQIVFVVRNPEANLLSIAARLELTSQELSQNLFFNRGRMPDAWHNIFYDETLYGSGIRSATLIEAYAKRWSMAVDIYNRNSDCFHLIRYEDFASEKRESLNSLASKLGLPFVDSKKIDTEKQFQPLGSKKPRLSVMQRSFLWSHCSGACETVGYREYENE
ncbi:sulfotransferase family protein [Neorhodopirellula lusitana]|uniref:sulfotransferase family protein n=1 Tax=Neorhodopirellula lusitana TaxID=445327 RepID=UPI00384FE30B